MLFALLALFFGPENGVSTFLRSVGDDVPYYVASHPRRQHSARISRLRHDKLLCVLKLMFCKLNSDFVTLRDSTSSKLLSNAEVGRVS
jgi:hypothetical protein